MATFQAADFGKKNTRVPEGGNGWSETYRYVYTAIAAASIIAYGIIPAGVEVQRVREVHDANTASLTHKLGFAPQNSADGPTADDDYWWGATAVTDAGAVESAAHPMKVEFPIILQAVTAGATATAAAVSTIVVQGRVIGVK